MLSYKSGVVEQPKEWGGQHWLWNVRSENKTYTVANVNDFYGSLGGTILHVRSSVSVFLDTFTMILKQLPTGFKEIVADCSLAPHLHRLCNKYHLEYIQILLLGCLKFTLTLGIYTSK